MYESLAKLLHNLLELVIAEQTVFGKLLQGDKKGTELKDVLLKCKESRVKMYRSLGTLMKRIEKFLWFASCLDREEMKRVESNKGYFATYFDQLVHYLDQSAKVIHECSDFFEQYTSAVHEAIAFENGNRSSTLFKGLTLAAFVGTVATVFVGTPLSIVTDGGGAYTWDKVTPKEIPDPKQEALFAEVTKTLSALNSHVCELKKLFKNITDSEMPDESTHGTMELLIAEISGIQQNLKKIQEKADAEMATLISFNHVL